MHLMFVSVMWRAQAYTFLRSQLRRWRSPQPSDNQLAVVEYDAVSEEDLDDEHRAKLVATRRAQAVRRCSPREGPLLIRSHWQASLHRPLPRYSYTQKHCTSPHPPLCAGDGTRHAAKHHAKAPAPAPSAASCQSASLEA
eukprot:356348-Chlamydomonas_euryale.AAC.13